MRFKLSIKKINSSGSVDKASEILLPVEMVKSVNTVFEYPEEGPAWIEDKPDGMDIVLHVKGELYWSMDKGTTSELYKWAGLCLARTRKNRSDDKTLGGCYRDVELTVLLGYEEEKQAFRKLHLPWAKKKILMRK